MNFDLERQLIAAADGLQAAAEAEIAHRVDPVIDAFLRIGQHDKAMEFMRSIPHCITKAFLFDRIREHEKRSQNA